MTNKNKIVLLASLALALSIPQSHAAQLPERTMQYIDPNPIEKAPLVSGHLQQIATTAAPAIAAPAQQEPAIDYGWLEQHRKLNQKGPIQQPVYTTPVLAALTPVKQEVSQNVAIIQSIEKIENSVEKIKGLYSLMQQAAGQNFDKEKESQKAFAVALVDAFNDARTANAYIQQLLQAATQTPLLNKEQQNYVAQTMIPLVADKAAPEAPATTATTLAAATPPTAAAVAATPPAATAAAAAQVAATPPAATAAAAQVAATPPAATVAAPAATSPAAKAPVAKPATKKIVKKVVKKTAAKKPAPKKTVVKKTVAKKTTVKPIAKTATMAPQAAAPAAK